MDKKWSVLSRYVDLDVVKVPVYRACSSGGEVPIIKTLFSSFCKLDCLYCPIRYGCNIERATWRKDRLVNVTLKLYNEGRVKGLFLSSSIFSDPDFVVEKELEVVEKLREKGFRGYIHLKLMPGVSKDLVKRAVEVADRVGLNLEAPSEDVFSEIAPSKGSQRVDILRRLEWASWFVKRYKSKVSIVTQFIYGSQFGADLDYIKFTYHLYKLGLRRVYYSSFRPYKGTPLENEKPAPLKSVYRLYQVSFLLRDYGIPLRFVEDILDEHGNLPDVDPKLAIAENLDIFPIDIENASYWELLLVPGIGKRTASKILELRERGALNSSVLRRLLGQRFKLVSKFIDIGDRKHEVLERFLVNRVG